MLLNYASSLIQDSLEGMELELAGSFHVPLLLEAPHALPWACENCCKVPAVTISHKSSPIEGMAEWKKKNSKEEFKKNLRLLISRTNQMQLLWRDWS